MPGRRIGAISPNCATSPAPAPEIVSSSPASLSDARSISSPDVGVRRTSSQPTFGVAAPPTSRFCGVVVDPSVLAVASVKAKLPARKVSSSAPLEYVPRVQ